jgi:hypothetical protein
MPLSACECYFWQIENSFLTFSAITFKLLIKTTRFLKNAGFLIIFSAIFIIHSAPVFSQVTREVGLDDKTYTVSLYHNDVKIYQASQNIIKFEVPDVSYAKISIYDKNSSLIRTYLFNNLREGTYEISTSSGNFKKGTYNCVLQTEKIQESSVITIN